MVNWDKAIEYVVPFVNRIFFAIIIFIVGKWIAKIGERVVETTLTRSKINRTLVVFTKNMTYFGVMVFVAIAALNKLGIETTSFVAIIGAAGLAVGLALQGALANFAAGVLLVFFQHFEVGDTIDAGGASGDVEEIQIFNTVIRTADNKKVIVPNAKITGDKIVIYPRSGGK